jgi:hypothetical protein
LNYFEAVGFIDDKGGSKAFSMADRQEASVAAGARLSTKPCRSLKRSANYHKPFAPTIFIAAVSTHHT